MNKIVASIPSSCLVLDSNGCLDAAATEESIIANIRIELQERHARDCAILNALNAFFDSQPIGYRESENSLVSKVTFTMLNGDMQSYDKVSKEVKEFLKNSPRFNKKQGPGNGTGRSY